LILKGGVQAIGLRPTVVKLLVDALYGANVMYLPKMICA
jgi:hypothetical protein